MYNSNDYINDDVIERFKTAEDMQTFLKEFDEDSEWVDAEIKSLSFYEGSKEDIIEGITDATFNDTVLFGTNMSLVFGEDNKKMYIGRSAIPTLRARVKPHQKNCKIRIAGNKVRAVHSGNYVEMPQSQIFKVARMELESYHNKVFVGGVWTHDYMSASWNIRDAEVINSYAKLFEELGISFSKDDIETNISVNSSDVGTNAVTSSSVTVWYNIKCRERYITLGAGLKLKHKGESTMSMFMDNMKSIFSHYRKKYYDLEKLKNVIINNPADCVYSMLLRADLPPKLCKETAKRFEANYTNNPRNGLIVYMFGVCDLITLAQEQKVSTQNLFVYNEKVARILSYDFEKYDKVVDGLFD